VAVAISGRRSKRRGLEGASAIQRPGDFDRLPLIATPTGRRTLAVAGKRYPLYARAPRHLTIEVEDARWP